jgi:hypothetical protein
MLYIDARQTGFSYGLLASPEDVAARNAECLNLDNANAMADGADFVRALLRFLDEHPSMRANPVVMLGESYGGTRATVMLYLLQHPEELGPSGPHLRHPALQSEILAHHAKVHPSSAAVPGPEVIAKQFGRQVLIQPAVAGPHQGLISLEMWDQPGSAARQLAEQAGIPFTTWFEVLAALKRDPSNGAAPEGWSEEASNLVQAAMMTVDELQAFLSFDPRAIDGLHAAHRAEAYRLASEHCAGCLPDSASFRSAFGDLEPWDRYFMLNQDLPPQESSWNLDPRFGRMFLSNLLHTSTFITNARWDFTVCSAAIPPALEKWDSYVAAAAIDSQPREGVPRPGWFTVSYVDCELTTATTRTVRFPSYLHSGHMVTATQAAELRDDIAAWLKEP